MSTKINDSVSIRSAVLIGFLSVVGTIGVLEWQGKIAHPHDGEQMAIASYKLAYIPKEEDGQYRLSQKPSHQTAFCQSGYLFIRNDKDNNLQGLLTDYKNRGVKCSTLSSAESE